MTMRRAIVGLSLFAAAAFAGTVQAQSLSGIANQVLGAGNTKPEAMLGQGLPDVASAGTNNLTGVLSYCVQRKLLSETSAASVLGSLTGRNGVRSSQDYQTGMGGVLQTGNGNTFSLDSLQDQVKGKLCDMVLDRAQSLL